MKLAKSLAGHDKGDTYVVVEQDETYVFLANGTTRTYQNPKKKKHKHVQMILHLPVTLLKDEELGTLNDVEIKRILKVYHQATNTGKEEIHVKDGCH